ncbi:hypothetical protein LSAT2_025516 [Lamellibrachia satsuma]|nr:hypothetical protein LSAT2_025516 [Lamellibrachia satsuma]
MTSLYVSEKPCLVPERIPHATTSKTGVVLFDDVDEVKVTCNTGYGVNGSSAKTQNIKCEANQTFKKIVPCLDINECENNKTCTCDIAASCAICHNTEGSFYCSCKEGYTLKAGDKSTCEDINECSVENGSCSHICTNTDGSHFCSCPDGYTLYLGDNFNGFDRRTHTLDINRTCVPVTCEKPPAVTRGDVLLNNKKTNFYYRDQVEVLCDLGYVIDDGSSSNSNSMMITCLSNKTWDIAFLNCTDAICERLSKESTYKNPATVIYPNSSLTYGTEVQLNCSVAGGETSVRTRTCLYDVTVGKYQLIGDSLECGEIACGHPGDLAGLRADILPLSTYAHGAHFTFHCEPGFNETGSNGRGDRVVRCLETGRWDLGGLRCEGPVCTDPGRPADGRQIATSYEVGKTVTFECDRPGFVPEPSSLECISNGGAVQWNVTSNNGIVHCVDREKPLFTACQTKPVYVRRLGTINVTPPSVTDNSGAIASLNVSYNLNRPVTEDVNITWTATDHVGNQADSCVVEVHVISK